MNVKPRDLGIISLGITTYLTTTFVRLPFFTYVLVAAFMGLLTSGRSRNALWILSVFVSMGYAVTMLVRIEAYKHLGPFIQQVITQIVGNPSSSTPMNLLEQLISGISLVVALGYIVVHLPGFIYIFSNVILLNRDMIPMFGLYAHQAPEDFMLRLTPIVFHGFIFEIVVWSIVLPWVFLKILNRTKFYQRIVQMVWRSN